MTYILGDIKKTKFNPDLKYNRSIGDIIKNKTDKQVEVLNDKSIILHNVPKLNRDYSQGQYDSILIHGQERSDDYNIFEFNEGKKHLEKKGLFMPSADLAFNIMKVLYEHIPQNVPMSKKAHTPFRQMLKHFTSNSIFLNSYIDWDNEKIVHIETDKDGEYVLEYSFNKLLLSKTEYKYDRKINITKSIQDEDVLYFFQKLTNIRNPEIIEKFGSEFTQQTTFKLPKFTSGQSLVTFYDNFAQVWYSASKPIEDVKCGILGVKLLK